MNPSMSVSTLTCGAFVIRCATIDGDRWFAVSDVCKALGIIDKRRGYTRYVRAVDKSNKKMIVFPQPARGRPSAIAVSEAGLDRLLRLRGGFHRQDIIEALMLPQRSHSAKVLEQDR